MLAVCSAGTDGVNAATDIFRPGEFFVGVNYWGSQAGIHMWRAQDWDEKEIEKDIAALASGGVEVLRVFPTWSEFQPVVRNLHWLGNPREYLDEGTERPVYDPLWLDPGAMARFRFFCDTAEKHNVKLMVSLVTGWMSGRLFFPRALEGKNLLSDPEALMWEGRFARAFVRAMRNHPAIAAWDLGNECNCMGEAKNQSEAWNWLNTISSAIRMEDSTRPVIAGMHSISASMNDTWNLQMQGELVDVLTPHPYPAPFRVDANRGPFNGFRNALHPTGQCMFYRGVSGKPAFPQEVGSLGPSITPDRIAAVGMRQQLFASWMHGMNGFLWWCAFEQTHLDYPPFENNAMERELGIFWPDGNRTPKPQAIALKEFKSFKDSLPFRALPPRRVDAVCLLSEKEDSWQTSFGALMLAKQAGFDLEFVAAETRELPESTLYFLPSGGGWESYTHSAWKRLLAKVEDGATVVVSRGGAAGYSEWQRVVGLEQQMWRESRIIDFELDGHSLHGEDDFTAIQSPVDCEVVAKDRSGNVVVSRRKYGKGQVIVVNFALEKMAMTKLSNVFEGDFSNELWRIYAYAAKEAGVSRLLTRDDPRLVVTEHPRGDGSTLVCLLNTRSEDVTVPIKLEGGQVVNAWNGKYWEGTVSIRANDGCILEVKTPLQSLPICRDVGVLSRRSKPAGAGKISIAGPRLHGGAVLKAEDFGFSVTNDDNGAAIAAAVCAAKRVGAEKVLLAPGVYRCFGDPIVIDGLEDFELDGCGAELVFRRPISYHIEPSWDHDGSGANFIIRNCRRVKVGNMVTDWDWRTMPLASCAKVVAVHVDDVDNESYIDFEFVGCGDRHPYYGGACPIQCTQPMTEDFLHFMRGQYMFLGTYEGETGCKTAWISPTCIRVYPFVDGPGVVSWQGPDKREFSPKLNRDNVRRHKVGETYRIAHAKYGKGGFTLASNEDFDLHDVEIPSCYGHAVYVGGTQRNWQLKNVTVAPRDWRHPISSSADTIHFVRSHGNAIIDNLTVKLEQDDAINVHDRFTVAKKVAPRTLKVVLERGARYFRPGVGNDVELLDPGYNATGWRGKCVRTEGETIEVDRDLPATIPEEGFFLVFDRTASSDGVIIRNCTFEDMEMRTLVNASDATLENCVFRRTNGDSLRCIADYTLKWWAEGMGTTNIVVRNCRFEGNCVRELVGSYYSLGADFVTWLGYPDVVRPERLNRRFVSDILVEGCEFVDSLGYFADLRFGSGLTFRNNRIVLTGNRDRCREKSGFARVERVIDATCEGNVFVRPDGAPEPCIDVADGVEGLVINNNRIIRQ